MKRCFFYSLAIAASAGLFNLNAQGVAGLEIPEEEVEETLEVPTNNVEIQEVPEESVEAPVVVKKTEAERADSLYAEYMTLQRNNVTDGRLFKVVLECVESCEKVLSDVSLTGAYLEAKRRLRDLYPKLEYGGVYFNQSGSQDMAVRLLEKYIMLPKHEMLKDDRAFTPSPNNYPKLVYFVASYSFNARDFQTAALMLKEYLDTHDQAQENQAYLFLGKAYGFIGQYEDQIFTLMKGLQKYPNDLRILHDIVDYHITTKNLAQADLYMMNYEKLEMNQAKVLSLKARLFELAEDFKSSLLACEKLYSLDNTNIDNAKQLGRASYNYVVAEMKAGKVDNLGKPLPELTPYLDNAAKLFVQVVNSKPERVYLDALIDTYLLLDRKDEARAVAAKIGTVIDGRRQLAQISDGSPAAIQKVSNGDSPKKVSASGVPVFSIYAQSYVSDRLRSWMQKGAYEKTQEYQARTSGESLQNKKIALAEEAKKAYIRQFAVTVLAEASKDIVIGGYDPDNEVYKIDYKLGYMLLNVPMANNAAPKFKEAWNMGDIKIKEPKFDVIGDTLALSGLTFYSVIDSTMVYAYDIHSNIKYADTKVNIGNPLEAGMDDSLDSDLFAQVQGKSGNKVGVTTINKGADYKKSDIDIDVPDLTGSFVNDQTFALIISNEHYDNADNVNFAIDDGKSFKNYCEKVLCLPEKNIVYVRDASYLKMKGEIEIFVKLLKAYGSSAKAMVYYSGHGVNDVKTRQAYFLSKDGIPQSMEGTFAINDFYAQLAESGVSHINVFLDCCFSGTSKSGNMLYSARGVAVAAAEDEPLGNMVVLSACSGDETASFYEEQRHGIFTYYLLKKLKDTNGDVTLGELYDYVRKEVSRQSISDHRRDQTPNIMPSESLASTWKDLKLRD